jgi:hypothetical protein
MTITSRNRRWNSKNSEEEQKKLIKELDFSSDSEEDSNETEDS